VPPDRLQLVAARLKARVAADPEPTASKKVERASIKELAPSPKMPTPSRKLPTDERKVRSGARKRLSRSG
jgi:hypothetical protein